MRIYLHYAEKIDIRIFRGSAVIHIKFIPESFYQLYYQYYLC